MFTWIGKWIDRIFALSFAVVFLQIPQLMHDYTQILSGHVSELVFQVGLIHEMAAKSGKSTNDLVAKFLKNSDPDIVLQGQFIKDLLTRYDQFSSALIALQSASVWSKPFVFLQYVYWSLLKETFETFRFALPLNLEGIIYAILGLFVGYGLFQLLKRLVLVFRRKHPAH